MKLRKDRLDRLAEHMLLRPRITLFNFRALFGKTKTGTEGCALAEMSYCFSLYWKRTAHDIKPRWWYKQYVNSMKGMPKDSFFLYVSPMSHYATAFFGLTMAEYEHLFVPAAQLPERYGGRYLLGDATRQEVAFNIQQFVWKMEQVNKGLSEHNTRT